MSTAIIMPKAGVAMESGTIGRWLKKIGEPVLAGEPILEIETDKVGMEVESEVSGFLISILREAGQVVPVTQTIGYIGTEAELELASSTGPAVARFSKARQAEEIKAPAEILPGKAAASQTPPARVLMTPAAGKRIRQLGLDPTAYLPSGQHRELRLRDLPEVRPTLPISPASPLARRVAELGGINVADVTGSGPAGRIMKRDVEASLHPPTLPGKMIPISKMRRVIAQRLSASMFTAPHFYLMVPIRADNLMQDRKTTVNAKGGKVSLNAYLMKFVAEALKKHPRLNSSWRDDAIFHFDSIDIGLAVALPDGLVTPVVRDCGAKGILEIDAEIGEMIPRALTGTLLPEEYSNAGFTISNLGSFGIEEFTAIINPPGSAILAVGAFVREVVVEEEDSISLQTRFHATLSCDHRVVDGAVGAAFLKYLRNLIEEPIRALR